MNRLWLSLGVLLLVLAVGIAVTWGLDRIQTPISQDLAQAAEAARQADWDRATALAHRAEAAWQKSWHFGAAVTDHEPMEEIDALFGELSVWQGTRNAEEFAAGCARLSRLTRGIAESHRLNWWNFL